MDEKKETELDQTRSHRNNLDHARRVYLSVVLSVPKNLRDQELGGLLDEVRHFEEKGSKS